jgi:8-oxo-dGTP pyrophosphatase MutT (NUDIX family)
MARSQERGEKGMRAHGPWIIEHSQIPYTSAFVDLQEDQVTKPDGSLGTYATVTLKPGVAVLPLDATGHVYLTRQFRYALGRETVEVPSGALESDEESLAGAQREIHEELGIQADEWRPLGCVDVDTSIVRCAVHLYLAQHLHVTNRDPDPTEVIQPLRVSFQTAIEMVMDGQITHAPSCVVILKAARGRP